MHQTKSIWTVLLIGLISACQQKREPDMLKTTTETFVDVSVEDDVFPPIDVPVSQASSIEQWLTGICREPGPKEPVTTYEIELFESTGQNSICLVGRHVSVHADTTFNRIVFRPSDMYFKLPIQTYKDLDRTALLNKLSAELTAFTQSETFQQSYLSKAPALVFRANGKRIWPQ